MTARVEVANALSTRSRLVMFEMLFGQLNGYLVNHTV